MYYRYKSEINDQDDDNDDDDAEPEESYPFGHVKFIALNAKKQLIALYTDAENTGTIYVMGSGMQKVVDFKPTQQTNASQLCWSGNDCPVLTVFN